MPGNFSNLWSSQLSPACSSTTSPLGGTLPPVWPCCVNVMMIIKEVGHQFMLNSFSVQIQGELSDICWQEAAHVCEYYGLICAACRCMWPRSTWAMCVCVCVCRWLCFVSVLNDSSLDIKPYLFREEVCLASASWLPRSWQTDSQPQFVYYFRTLEIVGTWKTFGRAGVDLCGASVWYRSWTITRLSALKWSLKRTML